MHNVSLLRTNKEITEIYNRHINTVYRVCLSLTGNASDAEDAVQSVFLKLIEKGVPLSDAEHEKAWLITASKNQCRDMHRQWWKKKVTGYEHVPEASRADIYDTETVSEGLMKLPSKYRLPLYLYYYEGYKTAEIAAMLELNGNTVKTRLRTAKKKLKLEIGDDYFD